MYLWKIERNDDVDYEQNVAHVIAADDEYRVRQIAALAATTNEPRDAWYDAATVAQVGEAWIPEGVVLTSNRGA